MTDRARTALLSIALGVAACGEDLPDDRTWESGHVRYHTRSTDGEVCADLVDVLDEYLGVIDRALGGQGQPDTPRVDYFKFADQADLDAHGPCDRGVACTDGTRVMSAAPFHQHELVHAYLSPLGFPPWLFIEGAAVALSCQLSLYGRPAADSWQTAMANDRHGGELYGAGGWLVAHLLASYEPAKFLQLYADLPHTANATLVSAIFERIYRVTLDQAWSDALARRTAPPNCPWECAQPPLNGSSVGHPAPTCGLDDLSRTFAAPPVGGAFVMTSTGARPVEIGACGPDNEGPGRSAIPPWSDGMAVVGLLGPGPYFVSFDPASGDLALSFPTPSPVDPACGIVAPLDTSRFSMMHVMIPRGMAEVHAALSMAERPTEIFTNALVDETQVQLCASCAGACTSVPRNTVTTVAASGDLFVRVSASPSDRPYVTTTIRASPRNDQLFGDDGDDTLLGGAGNDVLDGGGLHDLCIGGTGTNTLASCEHVP